VIRIALAILLLGPIGSVFAQPPKNLSTVEFWNWFFWEAFDNGKFRVRGVAQIRSQPHRNAYLRSQGGPILEWQASKSWNLIAGYYFQEFRATELDPEQRGAHRPFVGFEYRHDFFKTVLETRHLYEYFKALGGSDSARLRSRARFEFPVRLSPFAQNEVFYDKLGVQANRSEAGVGWKVFGPLEFQISAFREFRPTRTGGSRTVISTRFTFNGPWNKSN
jgi:hypothetical protein